MDKNRNCEYWYFRHRAGLLGEEAFRNLKEKFADSTGYKFIVIYLELAEESIKHGGFLRVMKASEYSNYLVNLSKAIGEDPGTVGEAVAYFIERGMIKILERADATLLHLPEVQNMIGKSSKKADRQRLIDRGMKKLTVDSDTAEEVCLGQYRNIYIESDKLDYLVGRYGETETKRAVEMASIAKKSGNYSNLSDYRLTMDSLSIVLGGK